MTTLVLVPLLMPQRIDHWQLMTMIAPVPPPPPPAPAPVEMKEVPIPAAPEIQPVIKVEPGVLVMPTEIPEEIARIIDESVVPAAGVSGGVPGAAAGGILRTVLLSAVRPAEPALPAPPPPPPPPPPAPVITAAAPVRVGGMIREPKVVKVVPPIYPKLAVKARITGTVVMEAVVTAEGTVDEVHIISGHPLLVQAAIDCVKQWRYEPTYLNGDPVPVILSAKVHFELGSL